MSEITNIAMWFTTESDAKGYLAENNILDFINRIIDENKSTIVPNLRDLARLSKVIKTYKVETVMEFGVGYSTLVMAQALSDNVGKDDFPGPCLYSVDCEKKFIELNKAVLPQKLKKIVKYTHASAVATDQYFNTCGHKYQNIPDVDPELIYIDGPDPKSVKGSCSGLTWSEAERTVLSIDVLLMEGVLTPGTIIVLDGRTNNARFIKNNLKRNWECNHSSENDVTVFILKEAPLGARNKKRLVERFGQEVLDWPEPLN